MAAQRGKQVESDESYKRRVRLYAWAVPGMHRAGPGERGGGSYGRRAVAAAKGASMQISVDRKGLICRDDSRQACQRHARPNVNTPRPNKCGR